MEISDIMKYIIAGIVVLSFILLFPVKKKNRGTLLIIDLCLLLILEIVWIIYDLAVPMFQSSEEEELD